METETWKFYKGTEYRGKEAQFLNSVIEKMDAYCMDGFLIEDWIKEIDDLIKSIELTTETAQNIWVLERRKEVLQKLLDKV